MKRRVPLCVMGIVGAVVVLVSAHGSSIRAQPLATLAQPGDWFNGPQQLYPGCNFISLVFHDGTSIEDVVNAVSPSGAVQALWRQTPTLDRFEGFSPAHPEASDLLSVKFLDPVWICIAKTLKPPVTPTSTPTPAEAPSTTPTPTPPPQLSADLVITGLLLEGRPQGNVVAQIKNNGPDILSNATLQLRCETRSIQRYDGAPPSGEGVEGPITVSLSPGQTANQPSALSIDVSQATYTVICTVEADFADPDLSNNFLEETFSLNADLAVTDIFPDNQPEGKLYARITNNGPDTLVNTTVLLGCSYVATTTWLSTWSKAVAPSFTTVSLKPGETKEFDVLMSIDNSCTKYDVTCEVQVGFDDSNQANNSYSETIPMWSGGGYRCLF